MGRFFAPTVESIGHGPSVQAAGDGLEGNYHAFLNSVPANGKCLVVVPGLDPLHHLEAICPLNAAGSIGDPVLVNVDDDKQLWVVAGKTHTTEINGVTVPLTGSAWITPTLINSWTNRAGDPPGYLKDPLGFVHLRGRMVATGTSGTSAFTLSPGFRPGNTDDLYAAAGYNGTINAQAAWADIVASTGTVNIFYATGCTDIGLGGITFLAEN